MKMSERVRELFGQSAVSLFWKQDGLNKAAIANRISDKLYIILEVADEDQKSLLDKLELEVRAYELMKIPDWLTKAVAELLGPTVTVHYRSVGTGSQYTLKDEQGRVLLIAEEGTQSRAALELNCRLRAILEASHAISRPAV